MSTETKKKRAQKKFPDRLRLKKNRHGFLSLLFSLPLPWKRIFPQ